MSRGNPPGYDVQRFWRAMSAEKQTRRCAARVGKLLDLRPVGAGCRESGQLSLRCRAGDLNWQVRLAPARNSPPSLQITGNGLTPRPSVCAPGYVAAHVALAALRPTLRQMVEESA
jgi:hypothetical protein